MKVYPNGLIILDVVDIICLGVLLGYSTGTIIKIIRRYYSKKYEDPLVSELKRISPVKKATKDKPLNVPIRSFPRGGQQLPTFVIYRLFIKNKRLGRLIIRLLKISKRLRQLKRLKTACFLLNVLLFKKLGIVFAAGGSITHIQILLIASTSSTIGALLALLTAPGGFIFVLGSILTLINRYEYVSTETLNRCKLLCEAAKQYHNKKLQMEMESFTPEMGTPFNINPEQGPFECTGEGKLYQRYLENQEKIRNQVQNFNKFKEKFPECNDASVEELKEKIEKIQTGY